MSNHPHYNTRRVYRETRREQFGRLTDIFAGAIALGKQHVVIPATDYPLLLELLAANEERLKEEERRVVATEVIQMFKERS